MSRTYRRGRKSSNIHAYIRRGDVSGQKDCFHYWDGRVQMSWEYTYPGATTYEAYVKRAIVDSHIDGRQHNVPRYVRHQDIEKQKSAHKMAIQTGWKTGDWEAVLLQAMRKDASWGYW